MPRMQQELHQQTGQTLKERDILHKSNIKTAEERSALYIHIRRPCNGWENITIIDRNFMKRRIKEALYIQASDNGTLINADKGTTINDSCIFICIGICSAKVRSIGLKSPSLN